MTVEAENSCLENMMSFVPFGLYGTTTATQDLVLSDGFPQHETEPLPLLESSGNLASSFFHRNALSGDFVHCLYSEIEKQRPEIDGFLQLESQRLSMMIMQEQTRQQGILSQKVEARIKNLVVQKDQELALARNKTVELQVLLQGAIMEAQAWEKKATEKEAIVVNLNNRLNLIRQKHCVLFPNAEEEDAVSFCDSSSSSAEDDPQSNCKLCRARKACVVFFPCRHLCYCKSCELLLEQCLFCGTGKVTSLEVFLD